jgi:Stage II sporulation protein E (SpoIIE)
MNDAIDPRPRRGRALVRVTFAALACCAIGLGLIPAASAKRDRGTVGNGTSTSSQPASQPATGSSTTSSSATGSSAPTSSAPASSVPVTPSTRHHGDPQHNGQGSGAAGTSGTAGTPGTAGTRGTAGASGTTGTSGSAGTPGAGGGREAAAKGKAHKGDPRKGSRAGGGAASQGRGAGEDGEASGESGETSEAGAGGGAQVEALTASGSGHKAKSGKGKRKEGAGGGTHPRETGKQGKGKSKEKTEPKGEAPAGEEASSTPPPVLAATPPVETLAVAQPVAPATAAVAMNTAAAAQSTPTAVSGLSTPVQIFHRPRAVRHRARADASVRGPASQELAAAPTARPRSGAVSRGARHGRARPAHGGSGGRVSRLVTTITKIVDVVPTGVRVLIAGLLALALLLAVRSGTSGLRARRLTRQRRELLDDVGLLQAALLPEPPDRLGAVGTSVAYRPAEGPAAGGDFYDVFALEDGLLAVILGDVSGHGRQALPHTALVRFTLRAYLEAGLSPREALQTAGAVLERQLGDVFATVVLATYQPRERLLTYACAGHPPPLVLGAQPGARSLSAVTVCAAPPIGMGMRTGTRQTVVSLPGRAQVCFYTDGVTEARVGSELFGAGRLVDELEDLGPDASASALLERVSGRADARPDDMAACVLSVQGEDDAPRVLAEELEIDRAQAGGARTESFLRACGIRREDVAEVIGSACDTAGRAGTVVLEVSAGGGLPQVAMRRDDVAHLHVRRAQAEVVG